MKTTKKSVLYSAVVFMLFSASCKKESIPENLSTSVLTSAGFVQYVIPKGEHYANGNEYKVVEGSELKFIVRFDSSSIYQTVNPKNQWDINKLYGFSDNGALHHQYSARFGWRWSEGALRLFAYTYNNGLRDSKEIADVPIGKELHCAIKIKSEVYQFSVEEKSEILPRLSTTPTAKGYKLYPYFGGDEVAPHQVSIWIKEER